MSQSMSNVLVHAVFSTKERRPFLRDRDIRDQMHSQLAAISSALNCPPVQCGGIADHVHLMAQLARTISIADWIKELKRVSSIWVKEKFPMMDEFHWQSGYGTFSVSQSARGQVRRYIVNQEEHHKEADYKTEFRRLLDLNDLKYDERYVWD